MKFIKGVKKVWKGLSPLEKTGAVGSAGIVGLVGIANVKWQLKKRKLEKQLGTKVAQQDLEYYENYKKRKCPKGYKYHKKLGVCAKPLGGK
jgi:hypothetical protein